MSIGHSAAARTAYFDRKFCSWVIVGDEHDIGEFGSDAAHDGTFQGIAISSAAEQHVKFRTLSNVRTQAAVSPRRRSKNASASLEALIFWVQTPAKL
jgi:hypothetical protein